MVEIWRAFRDGGFADFVALLLGVAGVGLTIAAVARRGSRVGRLLGTVAVGIGAAILGVAALGTWKARRLADRSVAASTLTSMNDRIRREDYAEARRALEFGLGFAAVPVLLGGVLLIAGRRQDRGGIALPATVLGAAGILAAADLVMLAQPLPGRDLPAGDPVWHLLDAHFEISSCIEPNVACTSDDWGRGCSTLDSALHPAPGSTFYGVPQTPADPSKVPEVDVPKLVAFCHAHAAKCPAVWHGSPPMLVNQFPCPPSYTAWETMGATKQRMCALKCSTDLDCCGSVGFQCKAGTCKMGP